MAPTYTIELIPSAIKTLVAFGRPLQLRLKPAIDALAHEPRPPGAKKLKGDLRYRIRVGDYRIIYEIRDAILVVLVIKIGHRREVYRGL